MPRGSLLGKRCQSWGVVYRLYEVPVGFGEEKLYRVQANELRKHRFFVVELLNAEVSRRHIQ